MNTDDRVRGLERSTARAEHQFAPRLKRPARSRRQALHRSKQIKGRPVRHGALSPPEVPAKAGAKTAMRFARGRRKKTRAQNAAAGGDALYRSRSRHESVRDWRGDSIRFALNDALDSGVSPAASTGGRSVGFLSEGHYNTSARNIPIRPHDAGSASIFVEQHPPDPQAWLGETRPKPSPTDRQARLRVLRPARARSHRVDQAPAERPARR